MDEIQKYADVSYTINCQEKSEENYKLYLKAFTAGFLRKAELKNCFIPNVSQQRELLKGYEEWLENVDLNTNRINKLSLIDRYLKTL